MASLPEVTSLQVKNTWSGAKLYQMINYHLCNRINFQILYTNSLTQYLQQVLERTSPWHNLPHWSSRMQDWTCTFAMPPACLPLHPYTTSMFKPQLPPCCSEEPETLQFRASESCLSWLVLEHTTSHTLGTGKIGWCNNPHVQLNLVWKSVQQRKNSGNANTTAPSNILIAGSIRVNCDALFLQQIKNLETSILSTTVRNESSRQSSFCLWLGWVHDRVLNPRKIANWNIWHQTCCHYHCETLPAKANHKTLEHKKHSTQVMSNAHMSNPFPKSWQLDQ